MCGILKFLSYSVVSRTLYRQKETENIARRPRPMQNRNLIILKKINSFLTRLAIENCLGFGRKFLLKLTITHKQYEKELQVFCNEREKVCQLLSSKRL